MKILFISQYFYPEEFKGNDIVFDLIKRGHEVTVLTAKPNYPKGKFYQGYSFFNKSTEEIGGAKVIRVPVIPRGAGGIQLILNYVSFIFFSYLAVLFRIKEKYDIILVQQLSPVTMALPGLWVKRKQKIPLMVWVLDLWPESLIANSNIKDGIIIRFIENIVRKIYNASDVILTSSKFFKKAILEKCDDLNKKIVYFPNWAEEIFTKPIEHDSSLPTLPTGFNVMFAGNLGDSQDFEAILKCAEETEQHAVNWIIVGDGRKSDWIKTTISTKKLTNIYMLGRFPLDSMPALFAKADAMLVSLKDEPIFALTVPAKVQAYMASGKIILGMLNGEGKELINNSNSGIAVKAGDYNALTDATLQIKSMSVAHRNQLAENSKNFYEKNFQKKNLMDLLELEIKEVIKTQFKY